MIVFPVIVIAIIAVVYLFMQQEKFGKPPAGERLELIQQSINYKNNSFQNQSHTPSLTEGATYSSVMKEFFFTKKERKKPSQPLPSVKTNLRQLKKNENVWVWMGHSSYFMQVDGKTILVDPVLSGAASPLSFTTRSFPGADIYTADDIPEIDFLFISHDHWDHLDYDTIKKLQPKIRTIITGLGTGQHLERWGFSAAMIIEKDWNETATLADGFKVTVTPARHFSGRGFKRNNALWVSFVLQTPAHKIYIGGDSGYDEHFKTIGNLHGPFDLAILECGQYDKNWKYIHMMPEEVVQAAQDLNSKKLLAVHWGKFALGNHAWDEPAVRVHKAAREKQMNLLTPMIGEQVNINDPHQQFLPWWENID
ncbi:MBL fold metallo-hydrolase [Ferruginibacter sp.]|nr:MBL fold metallo-hydrolase [Ferruginibacter sp.]